MKPSGQAPFCVAWAGTDAYAAEGQAVVFKDVVFDILEYPSQETTDPDPVLAVGTYIKSMYPEALVLGIDRIGEYVNPADTPAFYCRLETVQGTTGYCMNTISWFNARVAVHLIYPDAAARLKMAAAIRFDFHLKNFLAGVPILTPIFCYHPTSWLFTGILFRICLIYYFYFLSNSKTSRSAFTVRLATSSFSRSTSGNSHS